MLTGDTRHELACASCGAPLHDLKHLPAAPKREKPREKVKVVHVPAYRDKPEKKAKKVKKSKRRKGWSQRFMEEVFDVVEDIFD